MYAEAWRGAFTGEISAANAPGCLVVNGALLVIRSVEPYMVNLMKHVASESLKALVEKARLEASTLCW